MNIFKNFGGGLLDPWHGVYSHCQLVDKQSHNLIVVEESRLGILNKNSDKTEGKFLEAFVRFIIATIDQYLKGLVELTALKTEGDGRFRLFGDEHLIINCFE